MAIDAATVAWCHHITRYYAITPMQRCCRRHSAAADIFAAPLAARYCCCCHYWYMLFITPLCCHYCWYVIDIARPLPPLRASITFSPFLHYGCCHCCCRFLHGFHAVIFNTPHYATAAADSWCLRLLAITITRYCHCWCRLLLTLHSWLSFRLADARHNNSQPCHTRPLPGHW